MVMKLNKDITKNNFWKEKALPFLARYFNLVSLAAAFIVLIFGIWLVILPKYKELSSSGNNLSFEDEQAEYERNQKILEGLKEIKANYQSIKEEDLDKIEKLLPPKGDEEDLLILVEDIIKKRGGIVGSLSIEEAVDNESISQSGITGDFAGEDGMTEEDTGLAEDGASIQSSGSASNSGGSSNRVGKIKIAAEAIGVGYSNLKPLLEGFENSLRIMDIKNIDFDPEGEKVSLEIIAYYLKD